MFVNSDNTQISDKLLCPSNSYPEYQGGEKDDIFYIINVQPIMSANHPSRSFARTVYYSASQALRRHATGGNILIFAIIFAMLAANLPLTSGYYFWAWEQEVRLQIGSFNLFSHHGQPMTMLAFINDALMAVFFFVIGLEIKREILVGELSSIRQALLPVVAAVGGMIVPVVIFTTFSKGTEYAGGAAIPMATDIAFSLGVLAMLGKRVPVSLKIFLTTLAVADDIGGIIVIATCYSGQINVWLLVIALALLGLLAVGQWMRIQSKIFYIGIGCIVWFLFLNSGIHPTIAGVAVAFCVPARPVFRPRSYIEMMRSAIAQFPKERDARLERPRILTRQQMDLLKQIESASDKVISPLQDLEDSLHTIVNNFIVPLFAFANAGIVFSGMQISDLWSGVSLAVIAGLVVGKFLGIFLFSWAAVKLRIAPMPHLSNWNMMAAVAMLGGIGFTVSLFIANLSFAQPAQAALLTHAKLGIVTGSLLAGFGGYFWLSFALPKAQVPAETNSGTTRQAA